MSKALESVIAKLNGLSRKMDERAVDWSLRNDAQIVKNSEFEVELKTLKNQLSRGSPVEVSGFLRKQIFLNPSLLSPNELKIFLEFSVDRFKNLKKYLLKGWSADSSTKGEYFVLVSGLAEQDARFACPEWLEDWKNLRDGDTFINFLNSRAIDFAKVTASDLPSGQLQRLIYTYDIYKANYHQDEFFRSLEMLKGKIPIISSIGEMTKDVNIYNDIENILLVSAVLNCRLEAKRKFEHYGKLDEVMNQILLNPAVGDPRMNSVDPFWRRVSGFAKESYQDWLFELNREDFKFFFHKEILGEVNDDRVDFWSKYLGSMKRVQIVLSPEMRSTLSARFGHNEEVMRTINRAKYYLSKSDYCTAIFYFEKHVFIENHKTGAACYYFSQSNFKELDEKVAKGLVDTYATFTNARDESWRHHPRHAWMNPFSTKLAYLGIYENKNFVVDSSLEFSRGHAIETKSPENTPLNLEIHLKPSVSVAIEINGFLSELSYAGAEIIDYRPRNGSLWIIYNSKFEVIINRMKSAGHRVRVARDGSHATNKRKAWWVQNNE